MTADDIISGNRITNHQVRGENIALEISNVWNLVLGENRKDGDTKGIARGSNRRDRFFGKGEIDMGMGKVYANVSIRDI